ncbi:MAG: sporulation protein YqfC [Syntrophomonadaceae bacterium]|jgi:sporulation protein YqfC
MGNKKEILGKAMAEFLEIPKDIVLDLPKVTIIGHSELYLENHRGIIEYSLDRIRVNLIRGFMEIEGNNLQIRALMPEEMSITGEIRSIKYFD